MASKIALSGKSGSGKTAAAEYLVAAHGYTRLGTGEACREVCKRLFGTDSKEILNRVTDALKQIDPHVWIKAALSSLGEQRSIVFDSARFATDYAFLKERGFAIWRIEAPAEVRFSRMEVRGQVVRSEDEEHPAETELDGHQFDQLIDNSDADLIALHHKIEKAL